MRIEPVRIRNTNVAYLVGRDGQSGAFVVDPTEAGPISERAAELGWKPTAILVTHHHYDHMGGVDRLVRAFGARVYGPAREKDSIPGLTDPLDDGARLRIGGLEGRAISMPGHTRGAMAYLFGDGVFTGDTLFVCGCGRLFEGTPAQMFASLGKLRALPEATRVFPSHDYAGENVRFARSVEPDNLALAVFAREVEERAGRGETIVPSTIGLEKRVNPFLRWDSPDLKNYLALRYPAEAARGLTDPVALFSWLRRLKDHF